MGNRNVPPAKEATRTILTAVMPAGEIYGSYNHPVCLLEQRVQPRKKGWNSAKLNLILFKKILMLCSSLPIEQVMLTTVDLMPRIQIIGHPEYAAMEDVWSIISAVVKRVRVDGRTYPIGWWNDHGWKVKHWQVFLDITLAGPLSNDWFNPCQLSFFCDVTYACKIVCDCLKCLQRC